jgi:hypothetical protein
MTARCEASRAPGTLPAVATSPRSGRGTGANQTPTDARRPQHNDPRGGGRLAANLLAGAGGGAVAWWVMDPVAGPRGAVKTPSRSRERAARMQGTAPAHVATHRVADACARPGRTRYGIRIARDAGGNNGPAGVPLGAAAPPRAHAGTR